MTLKTADTQTDPILFFFADALINHTTDPIKHTASLFCFL